MPCSPCRRPERPRTAVGRHVPSHRERRGFLGGLRQRAPSCPEAGAGQRRTDHAASRARRIPGRGDRLACPAAGLRQRLRGQRRPGLSRAQTPACPPRRGRGATSASRRCPVPPADAIVRAAQRRAADLVVLGSSPQTMRDQARRRIPLPAASSGAPRVRCCRDHPGPLDASLGFAVPAGWNGRASNPAAAGLAVAPG